MSKVKMRCNVCGKWFQSANAKEVTCPDCLQKARKEKMAAKAQPPTANKPTGQGVQETGTPTRPTAPPKSKPASSGTSHWLDTLEDVKIGQPDQPTRPKLPSSPAPRENRGERSGERSRHSDTGAGGERTGERGEYRGPGQYREEYGQRGYQDERGPGDYREGYSRGPGNYREGGQRGPGSYRESDYHGPGAYRVGGGLGTGSIGQRPRQPMEGGPGRGPRPGGPGEARPDRFRPGGRQDGKPGAPKAKTPKPKPETPPKPKREKIPPPAPFVPTPEQIAQVEARYTELAVPAEFDGIRTQISTELGIPKTAVKKIVKDLRERESIPSWWELQTYKGPAEELEKIKAAYEPFLPLPPIGVHKTIAEELSLQPGTVYQAIKAIRLEMGLPQYNDPALHGLELLPKKKERVQEEAQMEASVATEPPSTETEEKIEASVATDAPSGETTETVATVVSDGNATTEE